MNAACLINQTSGKTEYYTPPAIIEAARRTMGSIDLDPASSAEANKIVKAAKFYTKEDDGLSMPWACGTLWMNHPFSRELNAKWIGTLISSYQYKMLETACCITYAATSEAWFRPLLDFPQCYLWPRTNYLTPDGKPLKGITKGSVVTYLGRDLNAFRTAFAGMGTVKV